MIIVQASSGTGNQLFQYAAGRSLSIRTSLPLAIDAAAFHTPHSADSALDSRSFILDTLDLPIRLLGGTASRWQKLRGIPRLRRTAMMVGRSRYECKGLWQDSFDKLDGRTYLSGYFQDQRYHQTHAGQIVAELNSGLDALALRYDAQHPKSDAALHVRRSDYTKHGGTEVGWFEGYYELAIRALINAGARHIAVFSDDPEWCRVRWQGHPSIDVQDTDPRHGGLLDLWRMSQHPRIALCNSTFSWWAARLASRHEAMIFAPTRWAAWCKDPEQALMVRSWHRLGDS